MILNLIFLFFCFLDGMEKLGFLGFVIVRLFIVILYVVKFVINLLLRNLFLIFILYWVLKIGLSNELLNLVLKLG